MSRGLDALLHPSSIAIVGASAQEGKAGNIILRQLVGRGFRVYPVNTKGDEALGLPIWRSVEELPEAPDLAVLALPAGPTLPATRDCVARGVGAVIAVAGGFGETGAVGRSMEGELAALIRGSKTRILGPNTLGVLVPGTGLDTLFLSPERLRRPGPGPIALISQSGSAILGELDAAAFYGATISAFVGPGNRLDIDENELLEYFAADSASSVIALYLESFADAGRFLSICEGVVRTKPLVLLKAGRSEAGARAVQLHTGSLAGSDRLTEGVTRQTGILRAFDSEELMDTAKALAYSRPLSGRRIAVVTSGGGWGIMAADYIEARDKGIASRLAVLDPETEARLSRTVLPFAAVRNPIDLTASATTDMLDDTLEALQSDPGVDAIFCCFGYQPPTADDRLTRVVSHWGKTGKKPLVATVIGSEAAIHGIRELEAEGVAAFPSVWRGVRALDALARRGEYLRRAESSRPAFSVSAARSASLLASYPHGIPLAEDRVKALLRNRGLSTPGSIVLHRGADPEGLSLSYPLVVKVCSAGILHKTERRGVVLGINDEGRLRATLEEMRGRFPGEDLLVEEMEPKGIEMIVGLIDDPTFGLSLMCGMGGILAELYQDVSFRRLPIGRADAEEMLEELKAHAVLEGFRGIKASRDALIDLLVKISDLGQELEGYVDQMDLNPVIVHEDRAVVVDAKLLWKPGAATPRRVGNTAQEETARKGR